MFCKVEVEVEVSSCCAVLCITHSSTSGVYFTLLYGECQRRLRAPNVAVAGPAPFQAPVEETSQSRLKVAPVQSSAAAASVAHAAPVVLGAGSATRLSGQGLKGPAATAATLSSASAASDEAAEGTLRVQRRPSPKARDHMFDRSIYRPDQSSNNQLVHAIEDHWVRSAEHRSDRL